MLHSYVRRHDGICFEDTLYECPLEHIENIMTRGNKQDTVSRDSFANYFTAPKGCVPWQYKKI